MGNPVSSMGQMQAEGQKKMLERQIAMQSHMMKQQLAMGAAARRDLFHWFTAFHSLATPAMIARGVKTKNHAFFAPIIPLTFILAYQYDGAYGNKAARIRSDAQYLLQHEPQLFRLPIGFPSVQQLDAMIATWPTKRDTEG